MRKTAFTLALLCATIAGAFGQTGTPFSVDSAAAYLRTLAVEIGPRPMGSPHEQRAMDFALSKFREFGLTQAYLMPISEYPVGVNGERTNTKSGVVVGILRGATNRIIVLGAHIDSADPEVPGANDDGSGSAAVIELARVLSQRKNESTIVFALFGGEEVGLKGSRYFVEHFADLDRVSLMLQLDMANGGSLLFPTLDAGGKCAPEWLVRASYEEYSKLGYTGLHYATDFFVFMSAMPGGGVGSDHEPFLEKNIPAIDFTSDPLDPIHTQQDNFENFRLSGLKRSGDLIYRLVDRFDGGVPEQKSDRYFLYEVATFPFFVPLWALAGFILITFAVAAYALIAVRRRRPVDGPAPRPKIPGLKLFLVMLIIQTFVWLSENIVSLIKGVRYPWMTDINGYFILGFFAACLGMWVSLRLTPKLRLRHDAYAYTLRAFIFLTILVVVFAFSSVKLALYPATALFLLGLAMIVRHPILKLMFWILSPHFMFRLLFTEVFDFLARFMHLQPDITPLINGVVQIVFIFFFSLWAFPFLLGFAAVYFDGQYETYLNKLRTRAAGVIALVLFAATVVVLSLQDSYSNEWRPVLRVEENFAADSSHGSLALKSSEYLKGTRVEVAGIDTTLRGRATSLNLVKSVPAPTEPWIVVNRSVTTSHRDSSTSAEILLSLSMKHRPFKLRVVYETTRSKILEGVSTFASATTARTFSMQWSAFPDSVLTIPVTLVLSPSDSLVLVERIEAVFVEEPQPASISPPRQFSVVRRATYTHSASIKLD